MFDLNLTRPPSYDIHGRPCYSVTQEKGLIQFQENHLIQDALAQGYTQKVATTLFNIIKKRVQKEAAVKPVDVMEVGGGQGDYFEYVKDSVRTYLNVEPGDVALEGGALRRFKDPRYMALKCSAESVPLPDDSFDVILSIASLDHVPNYRKALAEVSRLLRPGGIFMMTLNNRRSWWKSLLSGTDYLKSREAEIAKEHYFQWSVAECEANLSEFLQVREICTTTFIPFVPRLWRPLLPIADLVGHTTLRKRGANIVAVCQKH
ncbi:MAG TPA: methyltransferase domain-containing protein [Pyrinomonadaceae bacterium]|nr:methyltransferase domain-containing protein [Pyrinomonadaceae bacterium]